MTPVASVVIPTRGGAARLPALFSALEAQTEQDVEVVPVVDGDVDGSADVIRSWSHRLRMRPLVLPENVGRAGALNTGLLEATGEVLIRCDDDLVLGPEFVAGHVRRHASAESPVGVVGPYRNVLPDSAYARAYGRAANERLLKNALHAEPENAWRLWAGNVSVTRETAALIGGYDERYRGYGWEDVDYGYRLRQHGIPVLVAPELTVDHLMAATTTHVRALRALHAGAGMSTFQEIHGPNALPETAKPASTWGFLVNLTAKLVTERTLAAACPPTDALLDHLPPWVAEKTVALLVEAAHVAGTRCPHRAGSRF